MTIKRYLYFLTTSLLLASTVVAQEKTAVAVLQFEPRNILLEVLCKGCCMEIAGIPAKEFIGPLSREDALVTVLA